MSSDSGQQGPGPDEQALAQIAAESFQRQRAVYDPVIRKYAAMADDTQALRSRVAGSSNVSTQQAFGEATPGAVSATLRRGGSVGDTMAGVQSGKTQAEATGQAGAVSQAKNVELSELGQVIGFGRGQATQATTGLGQVGQLQTEQELRNARLAANQRAQIGSAVLGSAALAYGAYPRGGSALPSITQSDASTGYDLNDPSMSSGGLNYSADPAATMDAFYQGPGR